MSISTHTDRANQQKVGNPESDVSPSNGRHLGEKPAGKVQVPKDQASKLRTRALERFIESEAGAALKPRVQQVLRALVKHANNEHHYVGGVQSSVICKVFPHQDTIGKKLGCSTDTIGRALSALKAAGIISVQRRFFGNVYLVELPHPDRKNTEPQDEKPAEVPPAKPAELQDAKPAEVRSSHTAKMRSAIEPPQREPLQKEPEKKKPTPAPLACKPSGYIVEPSSVEHAGGVASFSVHDGNTEEQERIEQAADALVGKGHNSPADARKLCRQNPQITAEVVLRMFHDISGKPDNEVGIVVKSLKDPEAVSAVADKIVKDMRNYLANSFTTSDEELRQALNAVSSAPIEQGNTKRIEELRHWIKNRASPEQVRKIASGSPIALTMMRWIQQPKKPTQPANGPRSTGRPITSLIEIY